MVFFLQIFFLVIYFNTKHYGGKIVKLSFVLLKTMLVLIVFGVVDKSYLRLCRTQILFYLKRRQK